MQINEKYKIESDSLNITLYRRQTPRKDTGESWRAIAYFSNPKDALHYLINLEVMETGLTDLKIVVDKLDELYRLVNSLNPSGQLLSVV